MSCRAHEVEAGHSDASDQSADLPSIPSHRDGNCSHNTGTLAGVVAERSVSTPVGGAPTGDLLTGVPGREVPPDELIRSPLFVVVVVVVAPV